MEALEIVSCLSAYFIRYSHAYQCIEQLDNGEFFSRTDAGPKFGRRDGRVKERLRSRLQRTPTGYERFIAFPENLDQNICIQ